MEKLLGFESMKNTTTDKNLFKHPVHDIKKNSLSWNKIAIITTDGAKASSGKIVETRDRVHFSH